MQEFLTSAQGRRLAHVKTAGDGPGILFLGGFRSDMTGTKALHLQHWAQAQGRAFLRFDYSGHGASSGAFEDGCIGDWAEDAAEMLARTDGPQILVGSSMGGWIALLLARQRPDRVAGLIGIAAAPDFTETLWASLTQDQHRRVIDTGRYEEASAYSDQPYVFTRRLFDDGRHHLVLNAPLPLPFPVRLLQGTADADVSADVALRLLDRAQGDDITLSLVKGADHRFSTPGCLEMITRAITDISERRADA